MGSKTRQRCATVLMLAAIIFLVVAVTTIWILLGQGVFTSPRTNSHKSTTKQPSKSHRKEYIERTHLEDVQGDVEFVKPLKISPKPLHDHDLIFDRMRNNQDGPPLRHHSGHFRHKMAEVWDPHPHYVIEAFGRTLELQLEYDDKFLSPNLHVSRVYDNYTHQMRHDQKTFGCFYTGKVRGEDDSSVAVSLCNGMTGYITTSGGAYFIEPAERDHRSDEDLMGMDNGSEEDHPLGSFLHRIKKLSHLNKSQDANSVLNEEETVDHLCDTAEHIQTLHEQDQSHNIVEDELMTEVIATQPTTSTFISRPRREIAFFDDMAFKVGASEAWPSPRPGGARTTRQASDWDAPDRNKGHFLKVLMVVDKSMVQYYQSEEELKHYVLTLMSHVALLYKDASIGISISVSVVNIWMLNGTTKFSNPNSQDLLQNFCKWQSINALDRQHNVALLLTRDFICRKDVKGKKICTTLGVANVGSLCNQATSCAVIRDRGLSTSYTLAHELGHVLNMPHDDFQSCGTQANYLMTRIFNAETKLWWSECSSHFVTEFLESEEADCARMPPSQNYISSAISEILPGEKFQVDYQCALEFGSDSHLCPFPHLPPCKILWCNSTSLGGCTSNLLPWADGTSCGNGRWCHHGECIPFNRELLVPVTGGWGLWQQVTECSRTCGGGIRQFKRHCDSPTPQNGGSYCEGRSVRYESCNTLDCNADGLDFREIQCASYDGNTKNIANLTRSVQWVPKYGLPKREEFCGLYCRPKNSNAYYLLKDKVVDGTKCGLNSFDICVNGVCRSGGCDNRLDSTIELDECGVCGGDNSRCEEITGTYNISVTGYARVLRIPKGSYNLDIRQNGNNDTNYLVLVDGETGEYILNSKTVIAPREKSVFFDGIIISYSGSSAPVETIKTPKNHPLTRDLVLELLSTGNAAPPSITYRYTINRDSAPRYGWRLYQKEWSKCSSICSGHQYINPVCVDLATNKEQHEAYCAAAEKQNQVEKRVCNDHCQLGWNEKSRGPCSANCGQGVQTIYYHCVKVSQRSGGSYSEQVHDRHCANVQKPSPLNTCQGRCESTRWEYADWSACSVTCGGGQQTRNAHCTDDRGRVLDDGLCASSTDKVTHQVCNTGKCPVWTLFEWSPCSASCGRGYRTRPYHCNLDGKIYDSSACNPSERPEEREECNDRPCPGWLTGEWTDCQGACGQSTQTRTVTCHDLATSKSIRDDFCHAILKPNQTRSCYHSSNECGDMDNAIANNFAYGNNDNRHNKWITGAWSQCSRTCDKGTSSRIVVCRDSMMRQVDDRLCDVTLRPLRVIECNVLACPTWSFGGWGSCDSSCEKHRQVSCRNATGHYFDDSQCSPAAMPERTLKCKLSQCDTSNRPLDYFAQRTSPGQVEKHEKRYRWKIGRWKQCSTACGRGQRKRPIQCEDALNGVILVNQYCNHLKKPRIVKPCERFKCNFAWLDDHWSDCHATCGESHKTRNVTCHRVYPGQVVDKNPLPDLSHFSNKAHYCNIYHRPNTTAPCKMNRCGDSYVWRPGPWQPCTASCGTKGRQVRQVNCVSSASGRSAPKHYCHKILRPLRKRKCNRWKCLYKSCKEIQTYHKSRENRDYLITIRNRFAQVYCYKMDTHEPEEYISLHPDGSNFAENYDRRLKNPNSCPDNGRRDEGCDCLEIGADRSGVTEFWKVRLNITSLKIIGDDFTFSRQNRGKRVAYGTSGDCYSAIQGCSQGRFSVDLRDTSFRLSKNVRWQNIGKHASSSISRTDTTASGRCGGYCGGCIVDPSIGLQIEVW